MNCECDDWCRAEPQPVTDKHHQKCPKYNNVIRVVKVTHDGNFFYDADLTSAMEGLVGGDDYLYTIEFMQMLVREYDALPEFQGF